MSYGVNRRDLFRSAIIGGAMAAAVRPGSGQNPMPGQTANSREHPGAAVPDLSSADWKPVFLDFHQNETLSLLADRIIPQTDTPGAKAAQVNRFIDLILAAESRERQQSFLNAISYFDGEGRRRYGSRFVDLSVESQNELLEFLAFPVGASGWTRENEGIDPGHGHFETLKGMIAEAFYSTEIGMKSLGWDGQIVHAPPAGCTHEPGAHAREG